MRRIILLNGVYYELAPKSSINQRTINPFRARLGGTGSLEYTDFSQASPEEYYDFRNGIGKKRGLGSEARLDWSEGIDFTSEGQAVLGSLVTTAGAFGVAPVKIIDFQSATYAIGHNLIAKWNTGTSAWDSKHTLLANPIDAIVVTDGTDEYLIVSSATEATYTTDGAAWGALLTFTEVDTTGVLTVTANKATAVDADDDITAYLYKDFGAAYFNAISENFELYVASTSDTYGQGGMAVSNTVGRIDNFATTDISVVAYKGATTYSIILYRGAQVASDSYICSANTIYYCTLSRAASSDSVSVKIYSDAARTTLLDTLTVAGFGTATTYRYLYGFVSLYVPTGGRNFDGYVQMSSLTGCQGYLAWYSTMLRSIDTDGKTFRSSPTKDVDGIWTNFTLTGEFGTVYDLFEGKLLSDGTPTVYSLGTEGLYTTDITNQIAYKQEVSYPPLTYAGHKGLYWNANVWVATGYGILRVAPSTATFIGCDLDDGLPSGYQGYIYDMVTVNNWLVYCVNGGTTDKSSILKRNSSYGGNLQVYTTSASNKPIACLYHSPSSLYTNGRLWFGEGTDVKYMMFPDTTSNVKQISTYEYVNDSGYGTFPIFRKLAGIPKTALRVAAITKSCVDVSNEYIEVFYGLNGAVATTSLGTFLSSPKPTTLTFNSGLGTSFYTIQFAIKLYRGSTITNSPELESLIFYYFPTATRISSWTMDIEAIGENAQETFDAFETLLDTVTLVPFIPSGDPAKSSFNVKVLDMPSRSWWEQQGTREGQFTCTVGEISKD